jgi:glycosyltransferase involved in cell wall biosynthesis
MKVKMQDRRTKILFLIPSFRMGGAEIQLLSLLDGLDKTQYRPTVGVFYRGKELDAQFESVQEAQIVYLGKKNRFDLLFLRNLVRLLNTIQFDIVQPYNVSARLIGVLAAGIAGVHHTVVTERTAKPLYSSSGSRVYQFFESYAMRHATVLVANSDAGRQFAISRGILPEKARVIYNGIAQERLEPTLLSDLYRDYGISKNELIVGTIARMEEIKDPRTFIEAAQIVLRQFQNVRFILVGDGPLYKEMQSRLNTLGMDGKIILAGHQDHIADYLKIMDVFVLCSSTIEGCSNAIMEAQWMGKPVVATDVGGTREILNHGVSGFLVQPNDPAALADSIIKLLKNSKMRKHMGSRALSSARINFSRYRMVKAYEQLYDEMMWKQRASERLNSID